MNFSTLAILSCVGLCCLAFGNQVILNIAGKDRGFNGTQAGPWASFSYASRNPRRCGLGIALMVLGLVMLIASTVGPFFSYRAV